MAAADLGLRRLSQQRLTGSQLDTPAEVVGWLGAVQAQEYPGAIWSLGMRMRDASAATIERAFADGTILRTHVMRPTWHFVAPDDIRWLLELTAPRVKRVLAYYDRQLGVDDALVARSNAAVATALEGGIYLTRAELGAALAGAGILAEGQRLGHIIMHAEQDGVICSGPRRGKQFTYALLAERAPRAKTLTREEALAELARRYYTSHGPATGRDFAWWSGLTLTDARAALAILGSELSHEEAEGKTYWRSPSALADAGSSEIAFLLPTYDEFLVGYEGFAAVVSNGRGDGERVAFNATVVLGGCVVGKWRRTITTRTAVIEIASFGRGTAAEREAIFTAATRYGEFYGVSVECVWA